MQDLLQDSEYRRAPAGLPVLSVYRKNPAIAGRRKVIANEVKAIRNTELKPTGIRNCYMWRPQWQNASGRRNCLEYRKLFHARRSSYRRRNSCRISAGNCIRHGFGAHEQKQRQHRHQLCMYAVGIRLFRSPHAMKSKNRHRLLCRCFLYSGCCA